MTATGTLTGGRARRHAQNGQLAAISGRVKAAGGFAGRMAPGFLLSFADMMGIPSGLHAAYMAALACEGEPLLAPLTGSAAALLVRAILGMAPQPAMLLTLVLILPAGAVLHRCGNALLMGWTAMALLPQVLVEAVLGTAGDLVRAVGTVLVSALAAPVLLRGWRVMTSWRMVSGLEERIAAGFLTGMVLAGAGQLPVMGMNPGVCLAAGVTCCLAMFLGVAAGTIGGLAAGLMLMLDGMPMAVSVCLSVGGFMAGLIQPAARRPLTCTAFAAGCGMMILLAGEEARRMLLSALPAAVLLAVLPQRMTGQLQAYFRRFLTVHLATGDAYSAAALRRLGDTMAEMAQAVPLPRSVDGPRGGDWWRQQLCAECPDCEGCEAMLSELAVSRAEEAWQQRNCEDEAWPDALEKLRGLGCGRLYCLREGMTRLRADEPAVRQRYRRACTQRDMLVTHLTAMAGEAYRLSMTSGGENWWDELGARNIRKAIDEQAFPASLMYLRRVDGRIRAAVEVCQTFLARKLAEDACRLVGDAVGTEMEVERLDGDRVYLCERPVWMVTCGMAERAVREDGDTGDHAWAGRVTGGRYVAAVSDGMGQGTRAGEESGRAVSLLRLCLEAGYTRAQTLTAVNGMMLLETGGERFATVDLLCVDLWTGQASLDKMGAAASWLQRGGTLAELTGDALPLGILETVESRMSLLRLRGGDRLILMTDGVEDAFPDKRGLQDAIRAALAEDDPDSAARRLMESAASGSVKGHEDDMTVLVLSFSDRRDAS